MTISNRAEKQEKGPKARNATTNTFLSLTIMCKFQLRIIIL